MSQALVRFRKFFGEQRFLTAAVMIALCGCNDRERKEDRSAVVLSALHASYDGDFYQGFPWSFQVQETGAGRLKVGDIETAFNLRKEQVRKMQTMLEQSRFFELPAQIGAPVPDGAERRLKVIAAQRTYEVTLYYLPNLDKPDERRAARRFLDVWVFVRDLFDSTDAADDREEARAFDP